MLGLLWMQRLVENIGATWGIDSYMGLKDFQSNVTGKFVQTHYTRKEVCNTIIQSPYCLFYCFWEKGSIIWSSGSTLVLRKKFSAQNFWSDCRRHKVTTVPYVGEVMRYLVSQPKVYSMSSIQCSLPGKHMSVLSNELNCRLELRMR